MMPVTYFGGLSALTAQMIGDVEPRTTATCQLIVDVADILQAG
jgi:hypothetical protein